MVKVISINIKFTCLFSLLLLSFNDLYSQYYFERELATSVIQNGVKLNMPWVGGLNGTQYSQFDFNNDGLLDIVAYDRSTEIIHCFVKTNEGYRYSPEYNHIFPDAVQNFLQLVDFNQDGKLDLFTAGNLGVVAFENVSSGANFKWEKVNDFLTYESTSGNNVNLQLIFNDYPHIADIDQDGDIDILNFNSNGLNSRIIFYENRSIDLTAKADILQLYEANISWGDLEECNCSVFVFNGADCNTSPFERASLHAGGKSVFTADLNNDAALELITSHQECNDLYSFSGNAVGTNPVYNTFTTDLLNNSETPTNSLYPNTMALRNAAGEITALIVSPNLKAQLGIAVDYKQSNWHYQLNQDGNTQLTTKAFLQEQMIDLGIQSSPAFWDYDSDGDLDLFVAYTDVDEQRNSFSAIALYKNTGDATNPSFELENNDFLSFQEKPLSNLLIQFQDINNDGRQDLACQATENGQNSLSLYFGNSDGSFAPPQVINDVFIGFGYSFHFTQVQGDKNLDLLIGKSSGGLILYENKSTDSGLKFENISNSYLSINDDFFKSSIKVTTADLDNDQTTDLIVGDMSGVYKIYPNYLAQTQIYDSLFLSDNTYFLGQSNLLTTANLFDAQLPTIIAGSLSGGLTILRNKIEYDKQNPSSEGELVFFPNPSKGIFNISLSQEAKISIISVNGSVLFKELNLNAGVTEIDLSNTKAGMYIISALFSDGKVKSGKILIQ